MKSKSHWELTRDLEKQVALLEKRIKILENRVSNILQRELENEGFV